MSTELDFAIKMRAVSAQPACANDLFSSQKLTDDKGRCNRLTVAALVGALVLSGCGALPDKPQRATLYDFGPEPIAQVAANAPRHAPLALPDLEANARLDGTAVLYRLAYADANVLRAYGQARWSLAPAALLRQRLRDALAQQRTVVEPAESAALARTSGARPETLRLTLEAFNQEFDAPASSFGVVRVRATLTQRSTGGDKVLGQRVFTERSPAPSADAPGGVRALAAASDAVVAGVVQWVDALPRQ